MDRSPTPIRRGMRSAPGFGQATSCCLRKLCFLLMEPTEVSGNSRLEASATMARFAHVIYLCFARFQRVHGQQDVSRPEGEGMRSAQLSEVD